MFKQTARLGFYTTHVSITHKHFTIYLRLRFARIKASVVNFEQYRLKIRILKVEFHAGLDPGLSGSFILA